MNIPQEKQAWIEWMNNQAQNCAIDHFEIKLIDLDDDMCVMTMPVIDRTHQPFGILHGGVSMVLVESVASYHACWGVDLNEKIPVGVEINGSHLRSVSDGTLRAVGTVVRRSRNFIVHDVDIFHEETGKQITKARLTSFYKKLMED